MRHVSLCLVLLLSVALFFAGTWQNRCEPSQADRACMDWLVDRLAEAESIKGGASLEAFLRVFDMDGGLHLINEIVATYPDSWDMQLGSRYVMKACPFIKVEVDFAVPVGMNPAEVTAKEIKIKTISRPYLEHPFFD